MKNKVKLLFVILLCVLLCIIGLFFYEINKKHHHIPKTAEILIDNDALNNAVVIKENTKPQVNINEFVTFVSDIENNTANLETKKKFFGFYECDINYIYDEYSPIVTYDVKNKDIISIDENGIVRVLQKGETILTVTADSISVDVPITVYNSVDITEFKQNVVILKGESKNILNLEKYDIASSEIFSSNENVAAVDKNSLVIALCKGKSEIYTYTGDKKISTTVTVVQPVETLSLNNLTIYAGDNIALKASYGPIDADYGTKFTYTVSNTNIASINENTLSALKPGETVITVNSSNGKSAQATLTVLNPPAATPKLTAISKNEYDSYNGEKYTDNSPYVSYFKISFDYPVMSFRINYVNDNGEKKSTGEPIYKNAEVPANLPLYFAICINESDVLDTRGFSFTNKDGSQKYYSLHVSGRDGSMLMSEY